MAKLITNCPSCISKRVKITHIQCESCGTKFEGDFEIPSLLQLPPDDLEFIEEFLLTSGSLKEMAKQMDVSYPTVRNRLNNVIEAVQKLRSSSTSEREKILTDLENGKIKAKDAARKLREL